MKVKLDENLPVRAAAHLRGLGFDVDTVHDERLVGSPDETATPNKVRVLRPSPSAG
jgi:hypothetical protein